MFRFLLILVIITAASATHSTISKATCIISGPGGVKGEILFTDIPNGMKVTGSISGLTPGEHGFHVHNLGDLSNGCVSMAGHYNPFKKSHGAPADSVRHVGDLGNVVADAEGVAHIDIVDKMLNFNRQSIIGRGVVVHELVDDLGKGGHKDSLTTGNAGGRVGCGVIGISAE